MKNEIISFLESVCPDVDFRTEDELMDGGILDSMSVVQIIGELSVEYDISFTFADLTGENFNSGEAIAALVEKKLGR